MSSDRRRRLQRERQRRLRARRRAEHRERVALLAEKQRASLATERPDLYTAVTSPAFRETWWRLYGEPAPELTGDHPDAIEYRLEAMAEDLSLLAVKPNI